MGYQVTIKSLVMRILHLENPGVQQAWGRSWRRVHKRAKLFNKISSHGRKFSRSSRVFCCPMRTKRPGLPIARLTRASRARIHTFLSSSGREFNSDVSLWLLTCARNVVVLKHTRTTYVQRRLCRRLSRRCVNIWKTRAQEAPGNTLTKCLD